MAAATPAPMADHAPRRPALGSAVLPALLFWAAWGLLRWQWPHARWVGVSAQLWVAYSAAWLVLPARWWGLFVPLAAAAGALLGAGFSPEVTLASWLPPQGPAPALRAALPAFAFALLLHLPMRWWRWREEQALQLRLRQAEQTAAMADLSRQVSVAELKALQAQVEPHFLFNALASLQQLIRQEPATAERFLGELHDYLRLALPSMREPLSTVDKELALARAYLTVMAMRLGDRLRFDLHAGPGCAAHAVPPMMLLTLVENAMRHGIEPLARGGEVNIEARREGDRLVLEVRDDGAGLTAMAQAPTKGQGVGLANVRDRLASLYGDAAQLQVEQRAGGGVCARMVLPWNLSTDPTLCP
jgi:signal transduction histidine kinase